MEHAARAAIADIDATLRISCDPLAFADRARNICTLRAALRHPPNPASAVVGEPQRTRGIETQVLGRDDAAFRVGERGDALAVPYANGGTAFVGDIQTTIAPKQAVGRGYAVGIVEHDFDTIGFVVEHYCRFIGTRRARGEHGAGHGKQPSHRDSTPAASSTMRCSVVIALATSSRSRNRIACAQPG